MYSREELTRVGEEPDGVTYSACRLCGGRSWEHIDTLFPDDHEADCPLAIVGVLGVMVSGMTRARDMICGACPETEPDCVVRDWSLECHEVLMTTCKRYAYESHKLEDI